MTFNFNCHVSIRTLNSDVSKYKTTAKIATAAFFNHNIITTCEESVSDVLPPDYPFLLKSHDYYTVKEMFQTVINDYNGNKKLWNKGLGIMKDVKSKLCLSNIINEYFEIFALYN